MKIHCVYNSRFASLVGAAGITIYPFIFFADNKEKAISEHVLSHEWVHVLQVRKLGWFRFYATYVWIYFRNRFQGMSADESYYAVPYEQEAYAGEDKQVVPMDEIA